MRGRIQIVALHFRRTCGGCTDIGSLAATWPSVTAPVIASGLQGPTVDYWPSNASRLAASINASISWRSASLSSGSRPSSQGKNQQATLAAVFGVNDHILVRVGPPWNVLALHGHGLDFFHWFLSASLPIVNAQLG